MDAQNRFFRSGHICCTQLRGLHNLRIVTEEIVIGDMCKVAIRAM